jgi:hypothetical protein
MSELSNGTKKTYLEISWDYPFKFLAESYPFIKLCFWFVFQTGLFQNFRKKETFT